MKLFVFNAVALGAVALSVVALALGETSALADRPAISKRQLDHDDYDVWNTLSSHQLSRDGKWVMYNVDRGKVDAESVLHIRSTDSAKAFTIKRGDRGRFSYDSRFAVFMLTPDKQQIKKLKKEKAEPEQMPKAKLQILDLASGTYDTIDRVIEFKLPEENGDWIGYRLEPAPSDQAVKEQQSAARETYQVTPSGLQRPKQEFKLKKRPSQQPLEIVTGEPTKSPTEPKGEQAETSTPQEQADKKEKDEGSTLVLRNLNSRIQQTYPSVLRFEFSKNGKTLALVTSVKPIEDGPVDHVAVIELQSLKHTPIATGRGEYKGLAFSEDGNQLAFITNRDDYDAKSPAWTVHRWTSGQKSSQSIASEGSQGLPNQWWIATSSNQRFSEDGRRLFFETAPIPESVLEERKHKSEQGTGDATGENGDEDDDDDAVKLDIWHWQDPYLQPQQLLQAEAERNRDYRAVYNINSKRIVQLATPEMPVLQIDYRSKSSKAIAVTDMAYRKVLSWEYPGFQDTFLVNLDSGKREPVQQRVRWEARLSPEGRYLYWFDAELRKWFVQPASGRGNPINVSEQIHHRLDDELHDRPSLPYAYGTAGWTKSDKALLIYDRYDLWQVDPNGKQAPIRLTTGREKKIRFRYQRLDLKARFVPVQDSVLLTAFDEQTKASGYFCLKTHQDHPELQQLIMLPESVTQLQKAEASDTVLFTRSTFAKCPDLWASTLQFKTIDRISDINPQQQDYAWGTAELVQWRSNDGQDLDGILYRPEGFDPSRQYPMLVYFYERSSDRLHRYHTPAAGRASINVSFYVSRGYVVFIPDIPYRIGEPGKSAAAAILPGVESIVAKGFIDQKRIGMQGHSWGGYQTAYLVTQTDKFACAESGAPVSNMTSAYGGIRWNSGRSRMFQYERTQSRIGENLWTARDKYIANSPLFFADKINTPLLILHNDQDGAVPWYQGIELFVALRRLEKPAWMLNYNGNSHGVDGQPNRRDFAIRMQQFFDHYLKDAPEPEWMAVGVPAVKKGKELGLELLEPEN